MFFFIAASLAESIRVYECARTSRLHAGAIAGEQPKGLAQMFVSKVVSQTPTESITTYQAQSLSTGAVVVRVD